MNCLETRGFLDRWRSEPVVEPTRTLALGGMLCAATLVVLCLSGCSTIPADIIGLSYNRPGTNAPQAKLLSTTKTTVKTRTGSKTVVSKKEFVAPGTEKNPIVMKNQHWSLVLKRVHIGKGGGTRDLAVILRVQSKMDGAADDRWIVGMISQDQAEDNFFGSKNIVVWNGETPHGVAIEVKLVHLKKHQKEVIDQYLNITKGLGNFIPTYGQAAQAVVELGRAINNSRADSAVLMRSQTELRPGSELRYGAYAMLPQAVIKTNLSALWFDNAENHWVVMAEEKDLETSWVGLQVIKGAWATFEEGRATSLDLAIKKANGGTLGDLQEATEAAHKAFSATRLLILGKSIDFSSPKSIQNALNEYKSFAFQKASSITAQDNEEFVNILNNYLPFAWKVPQKAQDIDGWITDVKTLPSKYWFDSTFDLWKALP
jgi:hypothetical protein